MCRDRSCAGAWEEWLWLDGGGSGALDESWDLWWCGRFADVHGICRNLDRIFDIFGVLGVINFTLMRKSAQAGPPEAPALDEDGRPEQPVTVY